MAIKSRASFTPVNFRQYNESIEVLARRRRCLPQELLFVLECYQEEKYKVLN